MYELLYTSAVQYFEISQGHRNALIAELSSRAATSYSDADALFQRYFEHHPDKVELIGSHDCTFAMLVTAMIRWTNQEALTSTSHAARSAANSLQRY